MRRLLELGLLIVFMFTFGLAQYPNVTLKQLQQVPLDSLLIADTLTSFSTDANQARWFLQTSPYIKRTSPFLSDTVTVTALCVVPAKVITYTAGGWTMVLYDTGSVDQWGSVLVRANAPTDTAQLIADGFLNVAAGDIITMTGVISEFPSQRGFSLTQFQPIAGKPITIIGSGQIPKPKVKNVGDFYQGVWSGGKIRYSTGEPFEAMLVEFHNLTINAKVNTSRGTFSAVDASGNEISDYDWSHFFTLGHGGSIPIPGDTTWRRIYAGLGVGMKIDTIRGIISTSSSTEGPRGYRIAPLYRNDIVFGVIPPLITTHRRNPVVVPPDSTPVVSVRVSVQTGGSAIQTVALYYSVGGSAFTSIPMAYRAADTTYAASIPMLAANTQVRYFIKATDILSNSAILASSAFLGASSDTSKGFFFYTVLDRPLTIQDVQYTPFLNGRSAYLGGVVTLSGIITADTSQISISPLSVRGTNAWYMQSTGQPWSGIWLTPSDSAAQGQMAALRNGDSVVVKGTVQEQFDVTRLGNITSPVVRVSGGNPLPTPISLPTGTFSVSGITPSAEMYEGVLVRFDNVRVSDTAATQPDPTEYAVNDGSGAIVVRRDGMNRYSNMAQDAASGKTILKWGDRISSLTGIIYYSNNQYKIVPRGDADFGTVTGVEVPSGEAVPATYALFQNYPNPFNPSSLISYTVPSTVAVTLKVYNLLGQEIATLVNQVQAPGRYTVRFDSSRLSSGVYFYRLQAGSFVALRKMMLVK